MVPAEAAAAQLLALPGLSSLECWGTRPGGCLFYRAVWTGLPTIDGPRKRGSLGASLQVGKTCPAARQPASPLTCPAWAPIARGRGPGRVGEGWALGENQDTQQCPAGITGGYPFMLQMEGPLASHKSQSLWRTKVRTRASSQQQLRWGDASCPGVRLPGVSVEGI